LKKITATQFKKFVKVDPAWASHLTEDVEIAECCDLSGSKITHLSKHLYFTGSAKDSPWCAEFSYCESLKVATGNFSGSVCFDGSGIVKIKDLNIEPSNGYEASFEYCKKLRVATGSFPGFVNFYRSGVRAINRLSVSESNNMGLAASFLGCTELETATGTYAGSVDFSSSGIKEIKKLSITGTEKAHYSAKFCHCKNLEVATGNYPSPVSFRNSGINRIADLHIANAAQNNEAACFENCKNLKIATGTFPGFVDFSESGVEAIKDLHITDGLKNGKRANFQGCKNLKVDSARYPNYVFRGKSERRKREETARGLLEKLQAPRKKYLGWLRKLGITRVYYRYDEAYGSDPCSLFKGETEINLESKINDSKLCELNSELEMFFLKYTTILYDGWTHLSGTCGEVTWNLENDKMTIWHCWVGQNEDDYNEDRSEMVV